MLDNYKIIGLNGRPVINDSIATIVELGLGLVQIDLDEKNRVLTTSMWVKHVSLFFNINLFHLNEEKRLIMLYLDIYIYIIEMA